MRILFTALVLLGMSYAVAAEPYRVTPYFECLVGKGVTERVWHGADPDKAMEFAIENCVSADPGKPPADQDVVDNREYMRIEAYDIIASVKIDPDNTPTDIGFDD